MNKFITLSCFCFLLSSCSSKVIPLKGTYPETPIIQYSDNSVDKVWDHTIDFFAQKGLAIKIIDRSSGLIISDQTSLSWTFEDRNGKDYSSSKWVAIPMILYSGTNKAVQPSSVTGEWNVRIKADGSRTSINVNLVNIKARFTIESYNSSPTYTHVQGRSTGVFEKMIFDAVK